MTNDELENLNRETIEAYDGRCFNYPASAMIGWTIDYLRKQRKDIGA